MFDHQFVSERGPNKRCLCLSDCSLLPVLAAKAGFEKVCRFRFIFYTARIIEAAFVIQNVLENFTFQSNCSVSDYLIYLFGYASEICHIKSSKSIHLHNLHECLEYHQKEIYHIQCCFAYNCL